MENQSGSDSTGHASRKRYAEPRIVDYGLLSDITRGSGGSDTENNPTKGNTTLKMN